MENNFVMLGHPVREFVRGSTLEFIMEFPHNIHPVDFLGHINGPSISTTFSSHLRLADNDGPRGFIADLHPEPNVEYTQLKFTAKDSNGNIADTSHWPLGLVEFDVLIKRTVDGVTKYHRTLPVRFRIVPGVTQ